MTPLPVTVFLESRFLVDESGAWYATLHGEAGTSWAGGVHPNGVRLAARTASGVGPAHMAVVGSVVRLPGYTGLAGAVLAMPRLFRSINAAVRGSSAVVVKFPGIIATLATAAAKTQGKPVIAQVVGDIEDVLQSGVAGSAGRVLAKVARLATARSVQRADLVRYVTERTLQAKYPPHRRAKTIAFSDVELMGAPQWYPRKREAGEARIVAVGSQEQLYKGHDLLIHALARLRARSDTRLAELVLVGDGRKQSELRALARRLGVADSVRFLGHITNRELLSEVILAADVFALPSRTEGMPRALIEAMGLGVPCIATGVGGVPELLESEAVVPPDNIEALTAVLSKVLSDSVFAASLANTGLSTAARFSSEAQARNLQQWSTLIEKTVTERS